MSQGICSNIRTFRARLLKSWLAQSLTCVRSSHVFKYSLVKKNVQSANLTSFSLLLSMFTFLYSIRSVSCVYYIFVSFCCSL